MVSCRLRKCELQPPVSWALPCLWLCPCPSGGVPLGRCVPREVCPARFLGGEGGEQCRVLTVLLQGK